MIVRVISDKKVFVFIESFTDRQFIPILKLAQNVAKWNSSFCFEDLRLDIHFSRIDSSMECLFEEVLQKRRQIVVVDGVGAANK